MGRLYTFLWCVALPWLPLRLWWRGRKEPGYRTHLPERFGRYRVRVCGPVLWVHAVSLGEMQAARPLLAKLRTRYPDATILLTHMTATGRAAGATLADEHVVQAWLPYDLPSFAGRFLDHFQPAAGMLLETEVWPNLVAEARRRAIPLFLVNARLSERSRRGYGRIGAIARRTFGALTGVAAQSADDAARLRSIGAPDPVVVTGNLKFDVPAAPEAAALGATLRARFGSARPVWLAASTRDGEEALLLDAMGRGRLPPDTLTVLLPRHPQRFDAVGRLLADRGIGFVRRTAEADVPREMAVVLGDTMGEMPAYCAAVDVVLMGGSLLPFGGQNLIEPIAAGKPTIVGPYMFNFAAATAAARAAGAAIEVGNADEAIARVAALLEDSAARRRLEAAGRGFHAKHRGAVDRLWTWLAPQLDAAIEARASARAEPQREVITDPRATGAAKP